LPDHITLNHLEDRALLALQGPKAVAALAQLGLVPAKPGGPELGDMNFMEAAPFKWGKVPLGISRSGYTGEDGVEISVRGEDVVALADALCALPEVKPIGLGARDSLRLEAGLPLYGHDLDAGVDPIQAGLGFAVPKRRRAEGGFPGAARVQASIANGPPSKRVGLMIEGRMPAREGALIFDGDTQVGKLTSGGFSPSLQAPIAMGYVAPEHAAPGTPLEIDVRGRRLPASVVGLPFVPHRYKRKGV
ncbi:MAG: glycine cleavage system protein T, partial [Alphaproteobacteria bacterium]|nr:glycine cleavage system protein T [Alphaproteobacteria bacterium]